MAVGIVDDIVKILDALRFHKLTQNVDVAIRSGISRENVVVGNNDDLMPVPDSGVLAEFAFEYTDGSRTAHVVRHEHIGLHPDVVPGLDSGLTGRAGQNLFCQGHAS
jgi:hypothetical protein